MAGIIEGYSYDIFISYRQKDNKHDGWVTDFVNNLKAELESTFKEEISVYFDINPHDGLLETHDVDASLKEKLKCLIFIPIISRTYCDLKSFAWEHEFKAFVELASQDRFGLKIRLPNGNVANRVLPVRIHELEKNDIAQCEALLGGVLRGVEFVYRESGIDKPLTADDNENNNLNKTKYKLQVIKVGHAIRELIQGFKETDEKPVAGKPGEKDDHVKSKQAVQDKSAGKGRKARILSFTGSAALLLTTLLLFYPRIFRHDKFSDIRDSKGKISIAVLPFENLTGDTSIAYLGKGISSLIINGLGNSEELAVCDDPTLAEAMEGITNEAALSPSQAKIIAKRVNADTYITGSYQGVQDKYLVMINLVNAETGTVIWSDKVDGNLRTAEYLDIGFSLCEKAKNYLEIKALEKNADFEFRDAFPKSAEAYRYFIDGMTEVLNKDVESGIKNLKKSLETDSAAMTGFYLMYAYCYSDQVESSAAILEKIYPLRDKIPHQYQLWMEMWHACFFGNNHTEVMKYCDQLAGSGINTRLLWFDLGVTYNNYLLEYQKSAAAFENVMKINRDRGTEWKFAKLYEFYGDDLHNLGRHREEQEIYDLGLKLFPGKRSLFVMKSACYISQGDTARANSTIDLLKASVKKDKLPENITEYNLALIYSLAGLSKESELHIRKAFKMNSGIHLYAFSLIYLLIDRDLNVAEGIDLASSVLDTLPEKNVYYCGLRVLQGIGKYKQGKIAEAVEIMEKEWNKGFVANMTLYHYLPEARQALAAQQPK